MQYVNNPYMNMYPNNNGYNNYPPYNNYSQNRNFDLYNQVTNQKINQNGLIGEMVADYNEVISKNTPLDGSSVFFPLVDGSTIYRKQLNLNTGASQLFMYKLVEQDNNSNIQNNQGNIANAITTMSKELQELKEIVLDNITNPKNSAKGDVINE